MIQKVALALGSGGARGLAHIGAIKELEANGFEITSLSGTSMGSVISGLYAMNKLDVFTEWINKLTKREIYSLMDFTVSKNGLISCNNLFNTLESIIPDMNIEDMEKPYIAVATDIINGKEVHFSSGSFYEAIRASIAIPSVITPVKYNNTILVDGGVLNPVPVDCIKRIENDILVAVNLYDRHITHDNLPIKHESSESKTKKFSSNKRFVSLRKKLTDFIPIGDKQNKGYYTLLNLTTSAMLDRISSLSLELNKPEILINIPINAAKSFDFHKSKEIIDIGKYAAKESIMAYKGKKQEA